METLVYLAIGLLIGLIIGWLGAKARSSSTARIEQQALQQQYNELEKSFVSYQATSSLQLKTANEQAEQSAVEARDGKQRLELFQQTINTLNSQLATAQAERHASQQALVDKNLAIESLTDELKSVKLLLAEASQSLATANATNTALEEKLQTQKAELEALGKKLNTEFENIANKILDIKTAKFTELNKANLQTILDPLGKNIGEFKAKVEEVYDKESKERFSLGEKVKELAQLNKLISEEAQNLTKALKGEAKTQGRWGEMILESILEKSGLVKGREYFMEHQLLDADGQALRSDAEGKKMRPDAVIKYPDNRSVIIDSKVSLNAFTRLLAATDAGEQQQELQAHVAAIKAHIVALSAKGYDDYDKALDFVMMFIPSEPAYMAALQGDADLWNFAYDKRILLLSPTNLITSLKLIADLWKREYQNQHALEIAERGAKLYDKFVGFVANLTEVGDHLEKAQGKYNDAYKQLSTGNDNLVLQATKLKALGLKTKKELPGQVIQAAAANELPE